MQIDPKRAIPKEQQHPPPQSSVSSSGARSSLAKEENKVFVGGIHIEADESDLKQVFEEFGEVLETILMRDRDTGRSRGFGFVTFATHDGALKSCEDADIHIRGRRVEVKMAVPKGKPVPGSAKTDSNNDPYAAWAEYFKQYPEYYEAMMKAYSNPATMAAYYSQYYGSTYPGAAPGPASMPTSMEFPNNGPYDPTQYAGLMSAVSGAPNVSIDTPIDYRPPGTTVERFSGGDYYRSHGNRPERRHERSRRRSRSRSPTSSHSRSRSRSRGRNRSRSPSRDHHRDRRRDRTYQRPRRDVEQGHDNTSSLDQEQERQQYSPTDSMGRIDGLDQARPVDYSGGRDTSRHPRSYHPYSRSSEKQ